MAKKITIRKGQLGLLSRQGDYYQILEAGEYRLPWFNVPEVLIVNRDGSEVPERWPSIYGAFRRNGSNSTAWRRT